MDALINDILYYSQYFAKVVKFLVKRQNFNKGYREIFVVIFWCNLLLTWIKNVDFWFLDFL